MVPFFFLLSMILSPFSGFLVLIPSFILKSWNFKSQVYFTILTNRPNVGQSDERKSLQGWLSHHTIAAATPVDLTCCRNGWVSETLHPEGVDLTHVSARRRGAPWLLVLNWCELGNVRRCCYWLVASRGRGKSCCLTADTHLEQSRETPKTFSYKDHPFPQILCLEGVIFFWNILGLPEAPGGIYRRHKQ